MKENAADVWRLIGEENAHFYICGDAKMMAKDVRLYLESACSSGRTARLSQKVAQLFADLEAKEPNSDFTRIYPFIRDHKS